MQVDELKTGGQHDVFMQWLLRVPLPTVNLDVAATGKMKSGDINLFVYEGPDRELLVTTHLAHVSGWYGCCMFELHALKFT